MIVDRNNFIDELKIFKKEVVPLIRWNRDLSGKLDGVIVLLEWYAPFQKLDNAAVRQKTSGIVAGLLGKAMDIVEAINKVVPYQAPASSQFHGQDSSMRLLDLLDAARQDNVGHSMASAAQESPLLLPFPLPRPEIHLVLGMPDRINATNTTNTTNVINAGDMGDTRDTGNVSLIGCNDNLFEGGQ